MQSFGIVGIVIVIVAALVLVGIFWSFFGVWIRAWLAGAPVGLVTLVAMRLRQVPHGVMVDARIRATKAGIQLSIDDIEAQYLAGGNVLACVHALIAAQKAGIALDWNRACAIDLATKGSGKSVEEAVRTSVDPKVIDCPNPEGGRTTIDGVAKDGIQVKVKARVTVRTNLDRFVGGAKEDTIIARVGEGIVSTIGSSESYKVVLESPDSISKTVLARGLDVGTAFEILSIDIADVDVGENVGAKLQEAQAEANKSIAQAQAEIRRAAAVAVEQEMKARVQEMQAEVVRAQAQIPLAMAEAFRSGRLGVMDYYKMENIQSDTAMRGSIANPEGKK
ncbi:SigmaW regulon antibacterial [Lacunisphaera limnophila]|uniref:Flotillin-like protein FloA n=1 Tax=Lacunisphaera limnophila TaxID=1838286 RepID=A0A1D8AVY0_9BACT|nr:flotillin-like protein FloA [Lacunisphaera limnophila]AOS45054.1 SigmaW regulon antibacterial [Lacunisphaera limnophila]